MENTSNKHEPEIYCIGKKGTGKSKLQQGLFTIYDSITKKCISSFTKNTGKVYLVKNPFKSNYFIAKQFADSWLDSSNLPKDRYSVIEFREFQ